MEEKMKKYLILIITILICLTTSCQAKDHTTIYIGDDGYWYINNEKTGSYYAGNDVKTAYDLACEQGFTGSIQDWLSLINKILFFVCCIKRDFYKLLQVLILYQWLNMPP